MKSIFEICKKGTCGIQILGLELDNEEYAEESSYRHYSYQDSATINIVRSVKSNGEATVTNVFVTQHTTSDIVELEFQEDGLYEVAHIILPTDKYIKNCKDFDKYSLLYYYDRASNKIIKYGVGDADISKLLDVNPECTDNIGRGTSIIRSDQRTFCLCKLMNCFYKLCRELMTSFCGKCINKLNYPKQNTLNRDLVWMSINVITYLVEFGQYIEAQRILESLTGCGNICKDTESKNSESCGCN